MWHQVLIPSRMLIIPVLIMTTTCQAPRTDSVFVTSNHDEADSRVSSPETKTSVTVPIETFTEAVTIKTTEGPATEDFEEPVQDDVVFIPNDKEVQRNEEYLQHEGSNLDNIMGYKTMDDVMKPVLTTEKAQGDIIFITGKNYEIDKEEKEKPKKGTYDDAPYGEESTVKPKKKKLNCKNLDCDNTVQSVCGAKMESSNWRYRLFLNECYFRKVNCLFRNSENRFKEVSREYCKNIGIHQSERPDPKPIERFVVKPVQVDNTRRSSSHRRSMSVDIDGKYCAHACPTSCPEEYEPECAVSSNGQYRMFLNHCKLDLNSCAYGLVWRKRPIADCVGWQKADMRQNRGFIDWMQRVGIVDNKGRLVMT